MNGTTTIRARERESVDSLPGYSIYVICMMLHNNLSCKYNREASRDHARNVFDRILSDDMTAKLSYEAWCVSSSSNLFAAQLDATSIQFLRTAETYEPAVIDDVRETIRTCLCWNPNAQTDSREHAMFNNPIDSQKPLTIDVIHITANELRTKPNYKRNTALRLLKHRLLVWIPVLFERTCAAAAVTTSCSAKDSE